MNIRIGIFAGRAGFSRLPSENKNALSTPFRLVLYMQMRIRGFFLFKERRREEPGFSIQKIEHPNPA